MCLYVLYTNIVIFDDQKKDNFLGKKIHELSSTVELYVDHECFLCSYRGFTDALLPSLVSAVGATSQLW